MLINEAGLVRALKREYRGAGYTVFNTEEQTIVYAGGKWCVRVNRSVFPRRALAIIVEHMGIIPQIGEPSYIIKKADPQIVISDVLQSDLEFFSESAEKTASYCPIVMQGFQVFQEPSGWGCWGIPLSALEIIEENPAMHLEARVSRINVLRWEHEGEAVMFGAVRKAESSWAKNWERAVWQALESVDLHKEEET